jgi:hypothetical protein
MRRPVSGRDAVYAPKLSTCSEAQIKGDAGNEELFALQRQERSEELKAGN